MSDSKTLWSYTLALILALGLGLAGCGGDDDTAPVQPGGQGNVDDFDQSAAMVQADAAAQQAVTLVESMIDLAGGVDKSADPSWDYGWNAETERWEWIYEYAGEGYVYDWFYTVQYFNADDEAQQSVVAAVRIDHSMVGDADYHAESEGTVFDYDWMYEYDTSMTGLGSDTLNLTGHGGYDLDYTYVSAQGTYHYVYAISWQILGSGISRPSAGGCPTGTIRYDFPPFYAHIVFDGSNTAVSTLYDANGNAVAGGSDTHTLFCGTR